MLDTIFLLAVIVFFPLLAAPGQRLRQA